MVGRGAELDRLRRLAAPDRDGGPTVAMVGGESGVGKTRLVRELVQQVGAGLPVLAGQADPGALARPFELLLAALDGLPTDPELIATVCDLGRPVEERLAAGLALVEAVTAGGPAVVVFEDLHWADSESLTLFERLAEPDCGPLVLIGTYRPDGVHRRHPFGELLRRLERRHSITHIRLGRLDPLDVGSFLTAVYGRSPSFRVVEALHARTGGNPFFLEELLAAAGDDPDRIADQPLPWSLAELVRDQLAELEPAERRIVETAAVLGQRVAFDLLAVVTRTTEDELIEVLRSLVARGLLVEDEHDVFSFRHALAREAIDGELLGREKRRLHRAALDALCEANSTDLAGIAHHAAGAGDRARVVSAAREGSAMSHQRGATDPALPLAALGLAEADEDERLLAVAARAAWLAGLLPDAVAHNRQRLEVARRRGDQEAESAALRLQARLAWESGDAEETVRVTEEVATLAERLPDGHERGMALAVVAQSARLRDDIAAAVHWADRALEFADRIGDDAVRAHAMVEKGSALVMSPDERDLGAEMLCDAADLGERLGDDVVVARALHNLVRTDSRPRDAGLARRRLERMRAAAERAGFDSMAGTVHAQGLADLAEWEGDLDAAMSALEEGRCGDHGYLLTAKGSWFGVHEAGLALEAGDIERAAALTESLRGTAGSKASWFAGLAAHVASRVGDLPVARLEIGRLIELGGDEGKGRLSGMMVHDVVAAALRAGIPPAELEPLAVRIVRPSAKNSEGDPAATRAFVDAQLAEASGDREVALEGYARAAAADMSLYPYERATAIIGLARCLIAEGRLDEAKEQVALAEPLLERWRGWRVDELDAVRRRLGMSSDGVAGPSALTPREREVVALLAEGLTNAELAARLYISPKTAAVHVSNVLAKLGMSSRTEVAAWAVREELTPAPDLD